MLKVVVNTPPEYNLSKEALDQRVQHYEELAHEAEVRLGKYCELQYTFDGLSRKDIEYGKKEYMSDCILDIRDADYLVLADNWRSSAECLKMYKFAEALGIPVIDMTEVEND